MPDMIFDPTVLTPADFYRFMISAIVPRPIAFVSTVSAAGTLNLAPFSYFVALTNRPPLLGVSVSRRGEGLKDTVRNIRETGEFVVNVVHEPLLERMVKTSGDWSENVSEFELTGLTPVPSDRVRAPGVAESPIRMECRLHREIELGDATFLVGEIVLAHANDEVFTDGRIDIGKLHPVGRLGGDGYTVVRDVIRVARPKAQ
jgi:flavin reductase (DIM6/NTAB) family NADH-FMN oxidoreductase RutF